MKLREILQKIVDDGNLVKLNYGDGVTDAHTLLKTLSEPRLEGQAYMQPGLYIAEINEKGYLGRVLFRFTNQMRM
jgi:hypothetical protein